MLIDNTETLKVLAELSGDAKLFAGLAVRQLLAGHEVDVQVRRDISGYSLAVMELVGEAVVMEVSVPVTWSSLDEHDKLCLLQLVCQQSVLGAARTIARADAALRASRARWGTEGQARSRTSRSR